MKAAVCEVFGIVERVGEDVTSFPGVTAGREFSGP